MGEIHGIQPDLAFLTSNIETTNRLLKDPSNDNIIYAATSNGVYKTTDGGTNWPLLYGGAEFVSMEFKPGDPTYMYGGTRYGKIYRSTDSGVNWTQVLTLSGDYRVELAVSPNNPVNVYAVVVRSGSKLRGIYKSTDSGASFTQVYDGTAPGHYILGYYCDGSEDGGQGTYDLCLAADPNNASTLYLGGVCTWKSIDGGSSWSPSNMWTGSSTYNSCNSAVVHADKHFLAFQDGSNDLYECNDGGLYKTSDGGVNWSFLSGGMGISQIYRIGLSKTSSSDYIAGLQDNGTKSDIAGTWEDVLGGDGMECAIDPTDVNTQYGEINGGVINRTTNAWSNITDITVGLSGNAAWVTPYAIDPNNHMNLFIGYQDVWKSTNQGSSWTQISSWGGSTLRSLTIAPSNSDYIYAATQSILYKTTNGGASWTNITAGLPVGYSYITYVSVKDDDPLTVWVSFGEYNSYGVYQTTNGGSSWTNISSGLPNIPVMCVIQNKLNTTENELYAGTDVGVFVKVGTADWISYSTGLPNVVVPELEIFYDNVNPAYSRLRAATFGRGLWESELFAPSTSLPVADFLADNTSPAINSVVSLIDRSENDPTTWAWTISPSTFDFTNFTTSSSQNPQIKFKAIGVYQVSLTVSNTNGDNTETKTGYITVTEAPANYCVANSTGCIWIYQVLFSLGSINNYFKVLR